MRAILGTGPESDKIRFRVAEKWRCCSLPLVLYPLELLQLHTADLRLKLADLVKSVEVVEEAISGDFDIANLKVFIRQLHGCNRELIRLERRCWFQTQLAQAIQDFLTQFQARRYDIEVSIDDEQTIRHPRERIRRPNTEDPEEEEAFIARNVMEFEFDMEHDKDFRTIKSTVAFEIRYIKTSEYDLCLLPRRINSSFTAVSL